MIKMIILFSSLTVTSALCANSGFYFLRTEKSPPVISTAQTYYLFGSTPENQSFNPASIAKDNKFTVKAAYTSLFEKGDVTHISSSYRENRHILGMKIEYLSIGGMEGRDIPSEDPMYEFDSRNMIFSLSYAYEIFDGLYAGVSGKYLFEKIEFEDSYGYASSFGIYRKCTLIDGLRLGLSLNNYGRMGKLGDKRTDLPFDFLAGAGYTLKVSEYFSFSIANSTRYLLNDEKTENYSGLELAYQNKAFLRSGYRAHNEGSPYSFGLGFIVSDIIIDYSFTPFSDDAMGNSHSFSVGYTIK